ncbi:NUDIX hydrolase [Bacillus sp. FSL R5-0677]|uniref:NUDIX hydrolase n=1 Tax=Bacillus sp. FSL R5-0677 TaxID=2921581 RepID=UPI0020D26696
MVLQGKPEKKKMWSIPSGGKEQRETLEECCIREIKEKNGIYSRNINLSILAAFDSK